MGAAPAPAKKEDRTVDREPNNDERAECNDCRMHAPGNGDGAVARLAAGLQVRRRFDGSDTYFEIGVDLVIGVSPAPTAADHDPDNREDKEDALPAIETEFPHGASLAQHHADDPSAVPRGIPIGRALAIDSI